MPCWSMLMHAEYELLRFIAPLTILMPATTLGHYGDLKPTSTVAHWPQSVFLLIQTAYDQMVQGASSYCLRSGRKGRHDTQ